MSDIAEGFAFSYVGLSLWAFASDDVNLFFTFYMLIVVIASRFITIIGMCSALRCVCFGSFSIPIDEQCSFALGGVVRGCLCWAQVLQMRGQQVLITTTLLIIMTTTIGCGILLPMLIISPPEKKNARIGGSSSSSSQSSHNNNNHRQNSHDSKQNSGYFSLSDHDREGVSGSENGNNNPTISAPYTPNSISEESTYSTHMDKTAEGDDTSLFSDSPVPLSPVHTLPPFPLVTTGPQPEPTQQHGDSSSNSIFNTTNTSTNNRKNNNNIESSKKSKTTSRGFHSNRKSRDQAGGSRRLECAKPGLKI